MERFNRWIKTVSAVFMIAVVILFMIPLKTNAFNYQDEITYYGITAEVLDSGAVYFEYTINWKVLDDKAGGVSWVQIGIPNHDAEKFKALSDNITLVSLKL